MSAATQKAPEGKRRGRVGSHDVEAKGTDLTPAAAPKQTNGQHPRIAPKGKPPGLHRGPPGPPRVIDRIDLALRHAGLSGPKLATALGIKPQSLTNLRRKDKGGMRAELLVLAADFLGCDLAWLCTGRGGDYVQATATMRPMTIEIAQWIDAMSENDRLKAWAIVAQMQRGYWPSFVGNGGHPPGK